MPIQLTQKAEKGFRFTFIVAEEIIWILSIGMHDEGLGKK